MLLRAMTNLIMGLKTMVVAPVAIVNIICSASKLSEKLFLVKQNLRLSNDEYTFGDDDTHDKNLDARIIHSMTVVTICTSRFVA